MIFATCPTQDCLCAVLAHSVHTGSKRYKKGHTLSKQDIADIQNAGIETLSVIRLEEDDIGEDEAVYAIAEALIQPGFYATPAHTGRVNIFAKQAGLFHVEAHALETLNTIDEAITCATLRTPKRVEHDQMVATVKIIPFSVPKHALDKALSYIKACPIMQVSPFTPHKAGLILTDLAGTPKKLHEKAREILEKRIETLGSELGQHVIVPHEEHALSKAIQSQFEAGLSPILILGASATVDRKDTIPSAILKSGGEIHRFGMAVDPGNLLVHAELSGVPIIGVPGCARSPKLNGFDWVLDHVLSGLDITPNDWAKMAHGGLLKEIESRPQPRLGQPKIAAIILAAGSSQRMGDHNKLLLTISDKPMVRHAAEAALNSKVDDVFVVTGHDHEAVRTALKNLPLHILYAEDHAQGMGRSLACGITALNANYQGAVILLGDMPRVTSKHINTLTDSWEMGTAAISAFQGQKGNPVLLPKVLFEDLKQQSGDEGARRLLQSWSGTTHLIEMPNAGVLNDIDTQEDLKALG